MVQSSHFFWRYPLALAAVLVLSACGKAPETTQGMAAPKVSVAEVIEQPLNEWDEFTGRLEAPESVELRPRVSGYIDRVAFHEGALVKKGDLLFQIDPRPFEAEVKRLEAQLQQARAARRGASTKPSAANACAPATRSPRNSPTPAPPPPRKPRRRSPRPRRNWTRHA